MDYQSIHLKYPKTKTHLIFSKHSTFIHWWSPFIGTLIILKAGSISLQSNTASLTFWKCQKPYTSWNSCKFHYPRLKAIWETHIYYSKIDICHSQWPCGSKDMLDFPKWMFTSISEMTWTNFNWHYDGACPPT